MTDTALESCAPRAPLTFAGWVPTITGQLSFSLIGLGTNSGDCVTANVETHEGEATKAPKRHVMVYQERGASDLPFPFAKLIRPWVQTHFIMVGSSAPAARPRLDLPTQNNRYQLLHDEIGVLRGKVYVVPGDQPADVDSFIGKLSIRINEIERSTPRGTICGGYDLKEEFELVPSAAREAGVALADCDFELYRSGELRLKFDPNAPAYAGARDDAAEEGSGAPDAFIDGLSKQVYYFIKDVSHRHFHHDAKSDNILPAFQVLPGNDDGWRRDSLWSLSRAVLEHRRRNLLREHKRALGILAYAESFQAHLACVRRAADGGFEPSEAGMSFDFSHSRASLGSTIDELAFRKANDLSLFGIGIATALATVGLWIAIVQIADSTCKASSGCQAPSPPGWVAGLISGAITHPAYAFLAVMTVTVIWAVQTQRGIAQLPIVASLIQIMGGWAAALGASTSKYIRKRHPTFGDEAGAWVARISTTVFVCFAMFALAGIFSLHNAWPHLLTVNALVDCLLGLLS